MKKTLSSLIKKTLLAVFVALMMTGFVSFIHPSLAAAVDPSACRYEGQCLDNQKCHSVGWGGGPWVFNGPCGSAIIGRVKAPPGVSDYNSDVSLAGKGDIGIFVFASNAIQLFTALGGMFVFVNLIIAGFTYIAQAGNPQASSGIKDRLTYSLIGLTIMVAAYTIIAIFSYLIFGNPVFILNPDLNALGAL